MKNVLSSTLKEHLLWLGGAGNGERADLTGANLSRADLSGANLTGANLFEANLSSVNLSHANLYAANLSRAKLSHANLSDTDLSDANLSGADLSHANLSGADLSRATLYRADLFKADLSRANLSSTNLSAASGILWASCGWSEHGQGGRQLTAIVVNSSVVFYCGCFMGSETELRDYIAKGAADHKTSRSKAMDFALSCIDEGRN